MAAKNVHGARATSTFSRRRSTTEFRSSSTGTRANSIFGDARISLTEDVTLVARRHNITAITVTDPDRAPQPFWEEVGKLTTHSSECRKTGKHVHEMNARNVSQGHRINVERYGAMIDPFVENKRKRKTRARPASSRIVSLGKIQAGQFYLAVMTQCQFG